MAVGGLQSQLELAAKEGRLWERSPCPRSRDAVASLDQTAAVDPLLIRHLLIEGKVADGKAPAGAISASSHNGAADGGPDGPVSPKIDPAGIQICGALITDTLDVDGVPDGKLGLLLIGCRLLGPLTLRDSTLPWLKLERCILPAIIAEHAELGAFVMHDCKLTDDCETERISLARAHVSRDMVVTATEIESPHGVSAEARAASMNLRGAKIDGQLFLEGTHVSNDAPGDEGRPEAAAALCLMEATVGGAVQLRQASLNSDHGPALIADYVTIGGDVVADDRDAEAFSATGAGLRGAVCLDGASITGRLLLSGANLTNTGGPALSIQMATIKDGALLDRDFTAKGAVRLRGTTVTGRLSLEGSSVTAAAADDDPAELPGLRPADAGIDAALLLTGATVSDRLVLRGAELTSKHGTALMANLLTVNGDALLDRGEKPFSATGNGKLGAVCLTGSTITGQLAMSGAQLTHVGTGLALLGDLLTVKGPTLMDDCLHAKGGIRLWGATLTGHLSLQTATIETGAAPEMNDAGYAAALWLANATVGSNLDLRGATLTSRLGPAIMADYLTINGDARMGSTNSAAGPQSFTAKGNGAVGSVCLAGATITGNLVMNGAKVTSEELGPALNARDAKIGCDAQLGRTLTATAPDGQVVVSLVGASVGKTLSCRLQPADANDQDRDAQVRRDGDDAAARQNLTLRPESLDLTRATAGELVLDVGTKKLTELDRKQGADLITLEGLTYTGMPKLTYGDDAEPKGRAGTGGNSHSERDEWVRLLSWAKFGPQPYQALSAAYEGIGDDAAARRLMVAQRDDARKRGKLRQAPKFTSGFEMDDRVRLSLLPSHRMALRAAPVRNRP